jgi:hypothetical protein
MWAVHAAIPTVALVIALAVHVELLARLRRVDPESPPWWFGYARDGANLAAALMLWGAYRLAEFPLAVALLAAMLTTLATYLLDWTMARALRLRWARVALAVPLAVWVVAMTVVPSRIEVGFAQLVTDAQPAGAVAR